MADARPIAQELPIARALADWVSGLAWCDVPADQRALVGLRALDTVGLVLAGRETGAARAAVEMVEAEGGIPEATLLATGTRLPAPAAAFANALIAHCRDFDDTFLDSVVHPGSAVVPAALAMGEALGAPDDDVAAAIVAGYEVAARLGAAAGRDLHGRGFHATGIVGPFAAAAAAGRIMGLGPDALADAFGLAGSMAGGLMAFVRDGAWSKWLHAGQAARGGIVAARLAGRGFRGAGSVLDGEYGLYAAYLGDAGRSTPILDGLGRHWAGGAAHFKYYPCAHVIQPYIDAALALRAEGGLTAERVESATCRIAPWAVPIVCEPRAPRLAPAAEMDAIASLPFQVAAALADGAVTLDVLDEATRSRADLRALAARVGHEADPALGRGFDGTIEIRTTDGRTFRADATSAPPDRDKILVKFRANAGTSAPGEIEEAALGGEAPDLRRVARLAAELCRRPAR